MIVVDTCGWIEWLVGSKLSERFSSYLKKTDQLVVPTLIQYELYKWVCREKDEATALEVIGLTEQSEVVPLSSSLALFSADISSQYKLAMADAIVYSTALNNKSKLVTCDRHFKDLPDVIYHSK